MQPGKSEMVRPDDAVEIDMAERHRNLQQQRRKREVCAAPFMAVHPSHACMLTL
jgi:hypothetical protein